MSLDQRTVDAMRGVQLGLAQGANAPAAMPLDGAIYSTAPTGCPMDYIGAAASATNGVAVVVSPASAPG